MIETRGHVTDRARVWCLRHAESGVNVLGAGNDTPLTERGRGQAIAAARILATEPITAIYASTALRARQTAALLAAALAATPGTPGLPITAVPELAEVDCTAEVLRAWGWSSGTSDDARRTARMVRRGNR